MAGVTVDDARRGGRRPPHRRHPAGAADGVGDPGRRPPAARAGPRGRSRSSATPRPVTVAPLRRRAGTAEPGVLAIEVACSGGHLRPLAGRRPRAPARRRCPPARPAPHRRRPVHDRRGRPARRRATLLRADRRGARLRSRRRSTTPTAPRSSPTGGCSPALDGAGPWAVVDGDGRCSPSTSRSGDGQAKPAVVLPPIDATGRVASRPCRSSPTSTRPPWPGERDRRHDRRLRRRAPRAPGRHRRGRAIAPRTRAPRPSCVTFDRHPATIVRPESAPQLLTDPSSGSSCSPQTGVDATVVLPLRRGAVQGGARDVRRAGAGRARSP